MTNKRVLSKQEKQARKCFKEAKKECGKNLIKWQIALDEKEGYEEWFAQTYKMIDHIRKDNPKLPNDFMQGVIDDMNISYQNSLQAESLYKNLFLQWHILVRKWKVALA